MSSIAIRCFLPDNKHFLYLVDFGKPETNGINVGSLDGSPARTHSLRRLQRLLCAFGCIRRQRASVVPAGGHVNGRAFRPQATPNHGRSISDRGRSRHLRKHQFCGIFGFEQWNSRLTATARPYAPKATNSFGWTGQESASATSASRAECQARAISPDEKKILLSIFNQAGDASDLWLLDVERGVPSRSTFRPGISADGIWSPDGKHDRISIRQPCDLSETRQRHRKRRIAPYGRHQQSAAGLVAGWEIHRLRDYWRHDRHRFVAVAPGWRP